MKYDVVIIGAGPGGIFSAYELMKLKPELKVVVLEAGQPLEVHFRMENTILRISLVVLCMNILAREKQSI